jgi:hypothetical protein
MCEPLDARQTGGEGARKNGRHDIASVNGEVRKQPTLSDCCARSPASALSGPGVRIPIEAGQGFRREAGQRSDLMSATIPK